LNDELKVASGRACRRGGGTQPSRRA
jgi:hypothetical protein